MSSFLNGASKDLASINNDVGCVSTGDADDGSVLGDAYDGSMLGAAVAAIALLLALGSEEKQGQSKEGEYVSKIWNIKCARNITCANCSVGQHCTYC